MHRATFADAADGDTLGPLGNLTKGPPTPGTVKQTHLLRPSPSLQTSGPTELSPHLGGAGFVVTTQACGLGTSGRGEGARAQGSPSPESHFTAS